jgi:hypothetical protein
MAKCHANLHYPAGFYGTFGRQAARGAWSTQHGFDKGHEAQLPRKCLERPWLVALEPKHCGSQNA